MAGSFYPSDPEELRRTIDGLLAEVDPPAQAGRPVGLVVPHAGYAYSGPVAATAYALLRRTVDAPRVSVLGPAHFLPVRGFAVPEAGEWATPLGPVTIDRALRQRASALGAATDDRPHAGEHAVEVQLPFLQRLARDGVSVLPVAVGDDGAEEAAALVGALLEESFVVVSTDLSHYHPQEMARSLDTATSKAILERDPDAVGPDAACGAEALRGLLLHARERGLQLSLLDLRTSGDTSGDTSSVVGYGAFAVLTEAA